MLVDIRRYPGSRRHPQLGRALLAGSRHLVSRAGTQTFAAMCAESVWWQWSRLAGLRRVGHLPGL
ncbi:MAG TPA: hypothetical protein VFE14_09775 [Micromonosporaceae bacterium]|nr:hypothetical protein [Micromonosporaceae bacterium]